METAAICTVDAIQTNPVVDLVVTPTVMVLLVDRACILMLKSCLQDMLVAQHLLLVLNTTTLITAVSVALVTLALFPVAVEMVLVTTTAAAIKLVTAVLVSFALDLNKGEQWQSLV
jgi:hypothetical protein